jgi:nifR3 family TIM-barrel protein
MRIGTVHLANPFILAPLAGYTDLPFRLLCREYGAACCFSEMISCHGLTYRQQKTLDMLATRPEERPVAIQLFGAEPTHMGRAAAMVSSHAIDLIDINMGCPVKKVVKKGAGSALMKQPGLAREIIRQVVANTDRPVTVKIRTGWTHDTINAPEFARMAEEAGAAAITVHGRTWSDGFSGTVDWGVIARVKEAVSVPVIGNGDLTSYADGLAMMAATGCDGVMIGRAALGAPWIFSPVPCEVTMALRTQALRRHLLLIEQFRPAERMLGHLKSAACHYFKGAPGGAAMRQQIFAAPSFAALQELTLALTNS